MRFQVTALAAAFWLASAQFAASEPMHALAMHGKPALPADFQSFPYANPDAPKGGRISYGWQGSFDSLNPFIVLGDGARGLFDAQFGNNVFDTLMLRSRDEPFTLYPLLAESVETDADRSFVEFTLNPAARFSDGEPVTVDDVIFSFNLLSEKARPIYKAWLGRVDRMEKVGERGLRLVFNDKADRETPLLLAMLPILPEHATDAENFDKSSLKPLIGSGPYVVDSVRPGEVVIMKRNPDYWAKDLPSKRGFDNYDEVRINYFRDANTIFEAFKKGIIDIYPESDPLRWAGGYDFPAVTEGKIKQSVFETGTPSGMYGFVMNVRRPVFADREVRRAIAGLFDFEWANKNLYADAYQRTKSYFDGSPLSSSGRPADEAEKALLAPFPDAVVPEIMAGEWAPPKSDGSGRDRAFLKRGLDALKAAGYQLTDGKLMGPDGKQLTFEIMLNGKSGEPLAIAWQRTLSQLGIVASIRSVDAAQFLQRQRVYDFDTMLMNYSSSLSPGVEQAFRWGSAAADQDGTYNFAGVKNPAIDALIDEIVSARDRADFEVSVRAYDRVLLSGFYVVPLYHQPDQWIAHWANIKQSGYTPIYGEQFPTWWDDGSRPPQ